MGATKPRIRGSALPSSRSRSPRAATMPPNPAACANRAGRSHASRRHAAT